MRPELDPAFTPQMSAAVKPLLVASGKGGVGTSVTASLIAITASERGERVLLVDATEGSGAIHQLFGVRPERALWQLGSPRVQPAQVVVPLNAYLAIVPGGTSAESEPPADDQRRRTALDRIAEVYAEYDRVVFDGGSRLDTLRSISELTQVRLLLITSADRLALAANYALVKSIGGRMSDADRFVLANRHAESVAAEACEFLTGACGHFLSRAVRYVGSLPEDACLQAAVGAGMSVQDALDGSPAALAMRGILPRFASALAGGGHVAAGAAVPSFSRRWS